MPPEPPPIGISVASHCDHCHISESKLKGKLKRCAGCAAVVYCSKECQKKAWPGHKVTCRAEWVNKPSSDALGRLDDLVLGLPSTSVATLETALMDWIDVHSYGLGILATATVCINGGFDFFFSPDYTHAIQIALQPLPSSASTFLSGSSDSHPGKGFHPINAVPLSKAEFIHDFNAGGLDGVANWESAVAACRSMEEVLREGEDAIDPALVRMVPTIYNIKHSPTLRVLPTLVFPQFPHRRGKLDAEMCHALEDIRSICVSLMAKGLVLQAHRAEDDAKPWPQVGSMVRRKEKQWEWEPVSNWDWGRGVADLVPRGYLETTLHPHELWRRFFGLRK